MIFLFHACDRERRCTGAACGGFERENAAPSPAAFFIIYGFPEGLFDLHAVLRHSIEFRAAFGTEFRIFFAPHAANAAILILGRGDRTAVRHDPHDRNPVSVRHPVVA